MTANGPIVLRPVQQSDAHQFIDLAHLANIGITNLPKDAQKLSEKIDASLCSFLKNNQEPQQGQYIFVLEKVSEKKIIGISAIKAFTKSDTPSFFFKKKAIITNSPIEQVVKTIPILTPISYMQKPTELQALFISSEYRNKGFGKLLSFGRFLFMAAFPQRFRQEVISILRGVIKDDESPFWNAIGRHFFHATLKDAFDRIKYDSSFIADFLPRYPIYIPLLPHAAQHAISTPHANTQPALSLLTKQGFQISDEIDVFDAGPVLKAKTDNIHTIAQSETYQIVDIQDTIGGAHYLLGNEQLDFRATIGAIHIEKKHTAVITPHTADLLQVTVGDTIRAIKE